MLTYVVNYIAAALKMQHGAGYCCVLLDDMLYRFPRFITIRNDRRPEDASTPEVIVDLYNKQSRRMTSAAEMLASKNKSKIVAGDAAHGASDEEDDGGDAMDS